MIIPYLSKRTEKVKRYLDVVVIDKISERLNLKETLGKNSEYILSLVYSQLLDRPAINRLEEWLENTEILNILGIKRISTKRLYETLSFIENEIDFEMVENSIFDVFHKIEHDHNAVVIDITDTYFEGRTLNTKRRRGKDGRYKKLIQIGLAVTLKHGFPVFHKTYDGNISNIKIFKDMIVELKYRGFSSIIIDRGMYSLSNVRTLERIGMKGIVGVKKTQFFKKEFIIS